MFKNKVLKVLNKVYRVQPDHIRRLLAVAIAAFSAGLILDRTVLRLTAQGQWVAANVLFLCAAGIMLIYAVGTMQANHKTRLHRMLTSVNAAKLARTQAELSMREKSRLLATMSHEIRTPLNGVIGMLGLMLETELTSEQKNYLNLANASGRTLLSIVDEILDTAKSEVGPKKTNVDIVALVESVTELLAPRAHAKGIEISNHVSAEVPTNIESDELHLRQILFNIAGNAIKFTQTGGIAIEVKLNDKNHVVISVCDTGIGMTPEEAARVFQDYVQANENTAKQFGGTGLGLAISRKLVAALGGTIEVESQPNIGTTFITTLPGSFARQERQNQLPLAERHYALALQQGVSADHLAQSLTEFGAKISYIKNTAELNNALGNPQPMIQIICDASYAEPLQKWSKRQKLNHLQWPQVWIMLKAEERRSLKPLLQSPFAGYLLNPLRKSSLLNQLAAQDLTALAQTSKLLRHKAKIKTPVQTAQLHILLAEDNAVNALLARTMLERMGHKVKWVTDGQSVLDCLHDGQSFHLALLDVEMPKLDGLETTRVIRQNGFTSASDAAMPLPILALTANARAEDMKACFAAGVDDYLSKPFDQLDLEDKLNQLTKIRKLA